MSQQTPAMETYEIATSRSRRISKAQRRFLFNRATVEIWMCATLVGSDMEILLCCSYDGEPLMRQGKHTYVRTSWVRREKPKLASLVDDIERRVKEAAAGSA